MSLVVIGKNSSVYRILDGKLSYASSIIDVGSIQALTFSFEHLDSENTLVVIFSGVVSQDRNVLQEIETYHTSLLENLTSLQKSKILLISSSAVYGDHKSKFSEFDQCIPNTDYGKSKLTIEKLYWKSVRDNMYVMRLGNVLGLDTASKEFSSKSVKERFLDCRLDYSTPLRTYVDNEVLSAAISLFYCSGKNMPNKLNVGREKPQCMAEAMHELGFGFQWKITDKVLDDITLDTSTLYTNLNLNK